MLFSESSNNRFCLAEETNEEERKQKIINMFIYWNYYKKKVQIYMGNMTSS